MEVKSYNGMSNHRRDLIFRAMDGNPNALPILHFISSFHLCDQMLKWLISNGLTGSELCKFVHKQFGNSLLNLCKFILMKINRESEVQPIYVGKDVYSA